MAQKRVIIIGGGVGGLATGCYLRINGYETLLLEMGHECGGVTVPWIRGDYNFDGGTNWLPGSSPTRPGIHGILAEVLDFSTLEFVDNEEFMQIEEDGETFHVYTNAERLREEMIRLAPEDAKEIARVTDAIKRLSTLKIPWDKSPALMSPLELAVFPFANMSMIREYMKWRPITIERFSRRFRNKRLGSMFRKILPHHDFFSVLGLLISTSWMHAKSAGYLRGGSRKFIDCLEARYRELGGEILFSHKVTKIETNGSKAVGVTCASGSSHGADHVVSSADRHATLYDMLNGKYVSKTMARQFKSLRSFPAMLQVSLGIARSFKGEPSKLVTPLHEPLAMGTETVTELLARICNFDDCFAPEGKTAIVVHLRTHDYAYWTELREKNRVEYKKAKKRVADNVIETLENRFTGIKDALEQVDVATPATYVRYTGIWHASYQGWAPTPAVVGKAFERNVPGLDNVHLTGQWVSPAGGLPRCVVLGRQTAQIICRQDNRKFRLSQEG